MNSKINDLPAVIEASAPAAKPSLRMRMVAVANSVMLSMTGGNGGYDAGERSRFGQWGRGRLFGPDVNLSQYELYKNRVRKEVTQNPRARRPRNVRTSNVISDQGFIPRLDHFPEISRRWLDWSESKECDANGRHTFLGMQRQMTNALFTDGEVLARMRDRDPTNAFDRALTKNSGVGLQVQLMEIDHLQLGRNQVEENGTVTVEGENRSQYNGGIIGYYLYRRHPQAAVAVPMSGFNLPVWVSAADVLRISHLDRIGAARMTPPLQIVLPTYRDWFDYMDAEIARKGEAAKRTYVISMPGLPDDKEVLEAFLSGRGGDAEGTNPDGSIVVSLPQTGGGVGLPPGWKMEVLDPADVGEGFIPFNKVVGQMIASGTDQPYVHVTGDAEGLNDRMARWIDIQTERDIGFEQEEYVIRQFVRPIWQRWLLRAFYVDEVFDPKKYDVDALLRINFSYPKRAYVNRYQEAQADSLLLQDGTTSKTRIMEERGEDASQIAFERAMEAAIDRQLAPGSEFAKQVDAKALERLKGMLDQIS